MHFNIVRQSNSFLLFFNPIPIHHPDILFAMYHHMVYHADPQLIVKLCDWGIHFFQRVDKVINLCNPTDILLRGKCLFLVFLLDLPVTFRQFIKFFLVLLLIHGNPCVLHDECLNLFFQKLAFLPECRLLLERLFTAGEQVSDSSEVIQNFFLVG